MTTTPQRVLGVFADVTGSRTVEGVTRIDTRTFRWLPMSYVDVLRGGSGLRGNSPDDDGFPADRLTDRIFRTARLLDDPGALRVGWLWVAGKSGRQRIFFPLASVAVKVPALHGVRNFANRVVLSGDRWADVEATTEPELTELIADRSARERLGDVPLGRPRYRTNADLGGAPERFARSEAEHLAELRNWAMRASTAAGHAATGTVEPGDGLDSLLDGPLRIVVGVGLFVRPAEVASRTITTSGTLRQWAEQDLAGTAFAEVYRDQTGTDSSVAAGGSEPAEPIITSLRLDPSQRAVVASSVERPLTVVSGPPGTGKSQTVVATAYHHVRLGRSVLVAAPTDAAVSALVALIESSPGPEPIVFGNSTHRLEIANRLGDGGGRWFDDDAVDQRRHEFDDARRERDRLVSSMTALLDAEATSASDPASLLLARQEAPGFFDVDADLRHFTQLREAVVATGGWFARRRARRAAADLADAARVIEHTDPERLGALLDLAVARRRAASLEADGGLDLAAAWPGLSAADDAFRDRAGLALEAVTHHDRRADRSSRRAINAVAGALRAGRSTRRELLANVRGDQLLEALPLWIASVRDIDDLLPMTPGLFDLVIIDEASHLDQVGAAPALLRARSAVVVGDPRQLRHVSFVSDDRMQEALANHELAGSTLANQLDLRRQSAFDAAAAVAPVAMLREHYRSVPHLIDFSARHFYDGRISVATRHPRNEGVDRIDVVEVGGIRDDDGVNEAEVAVVIDRLRGELERASTPTAVETGARSVGVISPFRAQADAIEAAVIDRFTLAEIEALDLRVGTVHSFQGCQRDVVYLSLAIDDDSPTGSRSFLTEATLFNVMVTRAKEEMHVVTSLSRPDHGVLADYLRHAQHPDTSSPSAASLSRWAETVRAELAAAGLPITPGYRAGRHTVDLVLGSGGDALGVVCGVHPDGASAHIERHLSLVRRGWTLIEVFESAWSDRLPELAIRLGT